MAFQIDIEFGQDGLRLDAPAWISLPLSDIPDGAANQPADQARIHLLQDLWSNEQLEQDAPGRFRIPWAAFFDIDPTACASLDLPRAQPVDVQLSSVGIPGSRFSIEAIVRHPEIGQLSESSRIGPAYLLGDGRFVLVPRSVWELLRQVEDRPSGPSAEAAFQYIARCKDAATAAAARLDPFLDKQEVSVASRLEIDPSEQGDELQIETSVDGLGPEQVLRPSGEPRRVVNVPGASGRTKRILIPPDIADGVRRIRSKQRLRGSEVPQFLLNPEQFLPPGVDLSSFSERVRGFRTRVYNSRPYLHVRKSQRGWLEFDAGVKLEPATGGADADAASESISPEDYELLAKQARETGQRFVRHGDDWVEIDPTTSKQFAETVRRARSVEARRSGATGALLLDVIPNVELLEFEISLPDDLKQPREWMNELPLIAPPAALQATLDSEQLLGFRWLQYLSSKGIGGLLADEMGVGKTVQVIAHLLARLEQGSLTPSLIVLPKTLIVNWVREIQRFAPSLQPIHVHDGFARSESPEELSRFPLVITSYDVARRDQILLGTIDWKVVVADEAQFVKNPTASRTSALKALKAKQPIALTGTPVENGLLDFWCIMDFVHPGLLESWSDFRKQFERPLVQCPSDGDRGPIVERLLSRLDPHYLRRMKDEVLRSLPKKHVVEELDIPLGSRQRDRYLESLAETKAGGRGAVLAGIGRLLRICAHGRVDSGDWINLSAQQLVDECPKLSRTLRRIEEIKSRGEKVLIFAEWKEMQRILQRVLHEHTGVWADIVNGDCAFRTIVNAKIGRS